MNTSPEANKQGKVLSPLLISIAGSLIAGIVLYVLGKFVPSFWATILKSLPLLQDSKVYANILKLLPWLGALIAFIISFLIMRSRGKTRDTPKKPKTKRDLFKTALDILVFFGQESNVEFTNEELRKNFNLSFNKAQVAIDELVRVEFLDTEEPYGEEPIYWLSKKGRAFLERNGLL